MQDRKSDDSYGAEETQRRMETALRGARIVGHRQMKDISPKREVRRTASRIKKGRKITDLRSR